MTRKRSAISIPGLVAAVAAFAPAAWAQSAPPLANAMLPQDFSVAAMFLHADIVVKVVMAGLLVASVATWTVLVAKTIELVASARAIRRATAGSETEGTLTAGSSRLESEGVAAAAFCTAAALEMRLSHGSDPAGTKERIASRLQRIEVALARRAMRGTGVLATIGSTAPFVGLFGTVWGIMNSFIGISQSHTTNLAVVAPGIAEALLATAAGLVAAIPAVVIYNLLARATGGYRADLSTLSALVQRLASRELDLPRGLRAEAA